MKECDQSTPVSCSTTQPESLREAETNNSRMITRSKTRTKQLQNEPSTQRVQTQSGFLSCTQSKVVETSSTPEDVNGVLEMKNTEMQGTHANCGLLVSGVQLEQSTPGSTSKGRMQTEKTESLKLIPETPSDSKEDRRESKKNGQKLKQDRKKSVAPETTQYAVDRKTQEDESLDIRNVAQRGPSQKTLTLSSPNSDCAEDTQDGQEKALDVTRSMLSACLQESQNHLQRKGNGNASSLSSGSKLGVPRRVSQAYLQSTRARRRAIAKARSQRRESVKVEVLEKHRPKVGWRNDVEKERCFTAVEEESVANETVSRKEVRLVKMCESVEKSRVTEFVLDSEVENEADVLRTENEKLAKLIEWIKKENVLEVARTEVEAIMKKPTIGNGVHRAT